MKNNTPGLQPKTSGVVSFYDASAPEYDAWFEGEGRLIFEIELRALEEVLPFLPKPRLEVGIGSGRFALALGVETGIDPSVKMAEIARSRGLKVILSKGEKLPFTDGSFGTVFLLFTLCFVDSIADVLRETHRVLQPDGKVVVGEVLKDSPFGRYYQGKKAQQRWYQFSNLCQYQDLAGLLKEAGFSVEKVISTLHQHPENVEKMETPQEGYLPQASFTVILGGKAKSNKK